MNCESCERIITMCFLCGSTECNSPQCACCVYLEHEKNDILRYFMENKKDMLSETLKKCPKCESIHFYILYDNKKRYYRYVCTACLARYANSELSNRTISKDGD